MDVFDLITEDHHEQVVFCHDDKAGLKSIIAYRTGLDVSPLSRTPDQGLQALDAIHASGLPASEDEGPIASWLRGRGDATGEDHPSWRAQMLRLRCLLEEAYEAAESIESGDLGELREEIGDVLFQVFFHARIASERSADADGFTIDDVADTLAAKLTRRHPHVFGTVAVASADEVAANWDEIKKAERAAKAEAGESGVPSVLDGVPFGQPALALAAQLQRRAERAGITVSPDASTEGGEAGEPGMALGDELMSVVARARAAGLDPELELRAAARRFADSVRASERSRRY